MLGRWGPLLWANSILGYTPNNQTITASGGIDPSAALLEIQSDGGRVTITKNPQIDSGLDGQQLQLRGSSDTNTVILTDGNGLHLHGSVELKDHDLLVLSYDTDDSQWEEISRNFPTSEKSWALQSLTGGGGTDYLGGFYDFHSGNSDFTAQQTQGTANAPYGAHLFVVVGGLTEDIVTIRVTGTSITDTGVRDTGDTEDIVIPDETAVDSYFETSKKWIGQVTIDHISGTAKENNWGYVKYWDNNNNDFVVIGFEATFLGGANDATANILLLHHMATGWTYNVGSTPTPPTPIADMQTDYNTEFQIKNNEEGAWKRSNLFQVINGNNGEGTIIQLDASVGKSFAIGNFLLRIRTN